MHRVFILCAASVAAGGPATQPEPLWHADVDLEAQTRRILADSEGGECSIRVFCCGQRVGVESAEEPVVVRTPVDVAAWAAMRWTRLALIQGPWADVPVVAESSFVLAHSVPGSSMRNGPMPLARFLDEWNGSPIFDRDRFAAMSRRAGAWHRPEDLSWFDQNTSEPEHQCVSMGPSGEGLPLHAHLRTWQAQVAGKKLWLLSEPGSLPPGWSLTHPQQLVQEVIPSIRGDSEAAKLWRCILGPGDVIYFPDYWWHGTLNIGDSVSVGGEHVAASVKSVLRDEQRFDKHVPKIHQALGQLFSMDGQGAEALVGYREAVRLAPDSISENRDLIRALLRLRMPQEAERVALSFLKRVEQAHANRLLSARDASATLAFVAFVLTSPDETWHATAPDVSLRIHSAAVALDPENWSARMNLAHAHLARREPLAALEALAEVPWNTPGEPAFLGARRELCAAASVMRLVRRLGRAGELCPAGPPPGTSADGAAGVEL